MRNIGENEITNMGGDFNYVNCECITDVSGQPETNLFEENQFLYGRCINNGDGTLTSNIVDHYYCQARATHLNSIILSNAGNNIRFSAIPSVEGKRISIVIFGTRNGQSTYQDISSVAGGIEASGTIHSDFTDISYLELRWNRNNTSYTDTETVFSNFKLEIGE